MSARVMPFRPMIPELASIRVTQALSDAAIAAIECKKRPLTAEERACRAMKHTAALMDAMAADTQNMIERCRAASITHEQLIERLSLRLGIEHQTASMLRADVTE